MVNTAQVDFGNGVDAFLALFGDTFSQTSIGLKKGDPSGYPSTDAAKAWLQFKVSDSVPTLWWRPQAEAHELLIYCIYNNAARDFVEEVKVGLHPERWNEVWHGWKWLLDDAQATYFTTGTFRPDTVRAARDGVQQLINWVRAWEDNLRQLLDQVGPEKDLAAGQAIQKYADSVHYFRDVMTRLTTSKRPNADLRTWLRALDPEGTGSASESIGPAVEALRAALGRAIAKLRGRDPASALSMVLENTSFHLHRLSKDASTDTSVAMATGLTGDDGKAAIEGGRSDVQGYTFLVNVTQVGPEWKGAPAIQGQTFNVEQTWVLMNQAAQQVWANLMREVVTDLKDAINAFSHALVQLQTRFELDAAPSPHWSAPAAVPPPGGGTDGPGDDKPDPPDVGVDVPPPDTPDTPDTPDVGVDVPPPETPDTPDTPDVGVDVPPPDTRVDIPPPAGYANVHVDSAGARTGGGGFDVGGRFSGGAGGGGTKRGAGAGGGTKLNLGDLRTPTATKLNGGSGLSGGLVFGGDSGLRADTALGEVAVDGAAAGLTEVGDQNLGMPGTGVGMPGTGLGMPGAGLGGLGAGGQQKERERKTWLAEDEDVWGVPGDDDLGAAVLGREGRLEPQESDPFGRPATPGRPAPRRGAPAAPARRPGRGY